jgi:hypothetical protein
MIIGDHIFLLTILLCRRRKKIASYKDALRSSSKRTEDSHV